MKFLANLEILETDLFHAGSMNFFGWVCIQYDIDFGWFLNVILFCYLLIECASKVIKNIAPNAV